MTFPDVENILRLFLDAQVTPEVVTRVPNPRPLDFVRLWRTGGGARNRVLDAPLITLTAWGATDTKAYDNLAECREALLNRGAELPLLRGLEEVTGPYYDPDPDSGSERYSMTVRPFIRAAR